jgi:sRNA-binding carbon storage regulator CsrA
MESMLTVARKSQESLVIGAADQSSGLIRVTVLEVQGDTVRLGFESDGDVNVAFHHQEAWEQARLRGKTPNPKQAAERPQERPPYCGSILKME